MLMELVVIVETVKNCPKRLFPFTVGVDSVVVFSAVVFTVVAFNVVPVTVVVVSVGIVPDVANKLALEQLIVDKLAKEPNE